MVIFPKGGLSEMPMCEICHKKAGIHAVPNGNGYTAMCHECYMKETKKYSKSEVKEMIKEAIKEYESGND